MMRSAHQALALLILCASAIAFPGDVPDAQAQEEGPLLHEFVPADVKENIDLSSTDPSGELPAAIRTPSGTITPPDVRSTPDPPRVYQQPTNDAQNGFRPDRDTRRPHVEHYDDPFTPTLTPFKRMFSYDAVRDDYTLYVHDAQQRPVAMGGSARDGDDRFFGDMSVQIRAGEPVRIPSVGPDARLINLLVSPDAHVTVWRDGADNWFVMGDTSQRVRLVSEIAIDRDAFASEFPDVSWGDLPRVPLQPAAHQDAFQQVSAAIGVSKSMSPREAVALMVSYFRSFQASDDSPSEHGEIYLDLALSKKGVCRHRAFAFLVTALNLGIPTRLVHNEAHAWVEVRDHRMWHRIDLGGAALELEQDPHLERPPHVAPPDQFAWPTGRDSGSDLAHRDRADALKDASTPGSDAVDANGNPVNDPNAPGEPDPNVPNPAKDMPATTLTLDEIDRDIFRGLPVHIKGKATSDGQACPHLRVDVILLLDGDVERRLGSLSTDEHGTYAGAVVVPAEIPIGDHELVVATPGAAKCGPGQAR